MRCIKSLWVLPYCVYTLYMPQAVYAHKNEAPPIVKYHERQYKRYLKRAEKQSDEIKKHKEMLNNYQEQHFINKNDENYVIDIEIIQKHCDAIIKRSEDLREEYQSFASWHKWKAESLMQQ
ncbi:MAG: hypothetical protein H6756_02440 [Candidatus Omnitrophica bacterium]|nr:hypothetical protein [Candidatus Omnitrophota bacterium]